MNLTCYIPCVSGASPEFTAFIDCVSHLQSSDDPGVDSLPMGGVCQDVTVSALGGKTGVVMGVMVPCRGAADSFFFVCPRPLCRKALVDHSFTLPSLQGRWWVTAGASSLETFDCQQNEWAPLNDTHWRVNE
jgi:hypothetical protein